MLYLGRCHRIIVVGCAVYTEHQRLMEGYVATTELMGGVVNMVGSMESIWPQMSINSIGPS